MSETAEVCPGPLYKNPCFWDLILSRDLKKRDTEGALTSAKTESTTALQLMNPTARRPHKSHSQSPNTALTRGLGNCQIISISLTGILLIIGWIPITMNSMKKCHHQYLMLNSHANKLQEFEWSVVQNNLSAPGDKNSHEWTTV
jgi:hypothetical protein